MTLSGIRKLVVNRSGRYDLVIDAVNYVDSGANELIRAGQRFLDNRLSTGPTQGPVSVSLSESGGATYSFPSALTAAVRAVLLDSDLKFIGILPIVPLADLFGLVADPATPTQVAFDVRNRSITVYPAPNKNFTLQIFADLQLSPLVVDSDSNWWSEYYPEVLVRAALYQIEVNFRNMEGARGWLNAIDEDLRGIEVGIIEQESAGIHVLPDTW